MIGFFLLVTRPRYSPQTGSSFRSGSSSGSVGQGQFQRTAPPHQRPAQQFQHPGPPTPRPNFPQNRQMTSAGAPMRPNGPNPPAGNDCFKCGESGHYANACPKRNAQNSPAPAQQARNGNQPPQNHKGQQNYMRGRVNHMNAEAAQENPEVVLGMFLVNSAPASVLFDSGASHSFITSTFVAQHNLPISTMHWHMLVSSPGGI